jgi:hypothetical protein
MIKEIENESHIVVNSKDLLKIIKIIRLKIVKTCSQIMYKNIIAELEKTNNQKFLFLISKTPKILEQYWTEIYVDGEFKNKTFNKYLEECTVLYKDHAEFLNHMISLANLSENGLVYLSKHDAKTYNYLKNVATNYNHDDIKSVNNDIFDKLVKMTYKLCENI